MTRPQQNAARTHMINGQILTGDVIDESVVRALDSVDRSLFVPEKLKTAAYIDEDIPLGGGRYILEPLIFARMLKYAAIQPEETVLDVGCGTGYSAAVVSTLAQKVVALEENSELAAKAKVMLKSYSNVEVAEGELTKGAHARAPYDVILIEGAVEVIPHDLTDQLREGGRLLVIERIEAPKTAGSGLGKLVEYRKIRNKPYKTVLHDASAYLIESFRKPETFVF